MPKYIQNRAFECHCAYYFLLVFAMSGALRVRSRSTEPSHDAFLESLAGRLLKPKHACSGSAQGRSTTAGGAVRRRSRSGAWCLEVSTASIRINKRLIHHRSQRLWPAATCLKRVRLPGGQVIDFQASLASGVAERAVGRCARVSMLGCLYIRVSIY